MLAGGSAEFTLAADLCAGKETYRYEISVGIQPASGRLSVLGEYLAQLTAKGAVKGKPAIERVGDNLHIRRKGRRTARPPEQVSDIGLLGEHLAPFLYRLRAESPREFEAVVRTLRTLVPTVQSVDVDLDPKRGTLDITLVQDGVSYSSRIVSEGTLRVLALCAVAVNRWGGSLIGFEEPENGVHPRRLELVALLLWELAHAGESKARQVIVTTHSLLFCGALLRIQRERAEPRSPRRCDPRLRRQEPSVGSSGPAGLSPGRKSRSCSP